MLARPSAPATITAMDDNVAKTLLALNRAFYDTFAAAFSDSRAETEPGLERILALIEPGARVLDLGCGQGRLATLLPPDCEYVGVDYATEMLHLAREAASGIGRVTVRFISEDLVTGAWDEQLGQHFDWVILRAVLHHIPGFDRRLSIVRRAGRMLEKDGTLVLANWQFVRIPRLMRRALPWSEIELRPEDVDEGDYLLDWQRDGRGLRYVHLIDEAETRRLARDADLRLRDIYYADGHTDDLTLYALAGR